MCTCTPFMRCSFATSRCPITLPVAAVAAVAGDEAGGPVIAAAACEAGAARAAADAAGAADADAARDGTGAHAKRRPRPALTPADAQTAGAPPTAAVKKAPPPAKAAATVAMADLAPHTPHGEPYAFAFAGLNVPAKLQLQPELPRRLQQPLRTLYTLRTPQTQSKAPKRIPSRRTRNVALTQSSPRRSRAVAWSISAAGGAHSESARRDRLCARRRARLRRRPRIALRAALPT